MIRAIAVTTDFSELSSRVFEPAAGLARRLRVPLHVIHVVQPVEICTPWQLMGEAPQEAKKRADEARRRLESMVHSEPSFSGLDVRARSFEGSVPEAISEFLESNGVDLLVIASHGISADGSRNLGSSTLKLLEHPACPILVFPTHPLRADKAAAKFAPARILVPHDFSPASCAALETARAWAQAFGSSVRLVHVADATGLATHEGDGRPGGSEDNAGLARRLQEEAHRRLEDLIASQWIGLRADSDVAVGQPAVEILACASRFAADLVIVASHGVSRSQGAKLGSVASGVVSSASCPVLVVPCAGAGAPSGARESA